MRRVSAKMLLDFYLQLGQDCGILDGFGWIWMDFFHFCLIVFGDQECGCSHKAINFLGDEYA